MRIFTWYDIETELKKKRALWAKSWKRIDVYQDEIVVNLSVNIQEDNDRAFGEIFGHLYDELGVLIEFDKSKLPITYEEDDTLVECEVQRAPLFKDMYLDDEIIAEAPADFQGPPILAFHSYKGGVGRTLSLIALAKAVAEKYGEDKRVLIIDADMEAPGLTWMLQNEVKDAAISYLDVLSLMHFNEINEFLAEKIASLLKLSTCKMETAKLETKIYFLPVYRDREQLMHIFSSPEKIIETQKNKYAITEFISLIGKALGADLVLVDLRAGITEFSAPFLFDPRVSKYFITSTSLQSIQGIQLILNEVCKKTSANLLNAKILLTMIPTEMEERTKVQIEDELAGELEKTMDNEETTFLREGYLIRVPFESPLISLGDFQQICNVLKGRQLSQIMDHVAEELFKSPEIEDSLSVEKIKETLIKLNNIAAGEITAEGNDSSNMLSTESIQQIVKNHKESLPKIVVLGAKGSGKTYIYKQMISLQSWDAFTFFVEQNQRNQGHDEDVLFFPLLTTMNTGHIGKQATACIQLVSDILQGSSANIQAVHQNFQAVQGYAEQELTLSQWTEKWRQLMVKSVVGDLNHLSDLDAYLENKGKKIIFLIDGLEDIFMGTQIQTGGSWRNGLRALCQNIINELRSLAYENIGVIVFARKDMAEEAIEINFEQFKNQYTRYELHWTQTDALRLALWLAAKANPCFSEGIDILKASRAVLEEGLESLWGKKLGKPDSREAFSARWIIAALSDFTGQLQARDIVRFLRYATAEPEEAKIIYRDRYIMPADIKDALPSCSQDKLNEIKVEMKATYAILKKFEEMDASTKQLPLTLGKLSLTGDEIAKLESQGYLKISDKKYYLPEIIRYALDFRYVAGARPKVLSFLVQ